MAFVAQGLQGRRGVVEHDEDDIGLAGAVDRTVGRPGERQHRRRGAEARGLEEIASIHDGPS